MHNFLGFTENTLIDRFFTNFYWFSYYLSNRLSLHGGIFYRWCIHLCMSLFPSAHLPVYPPFFPYHEISGTIYFSYQHIYYYIGRWAKIGQKSPNQINGSIWQVSYSFSEKKFHWQPYWCLSKSGICPDMFNWTKWRLR